MIKLQRTGQETVGAVRLDAEDLGGQSLVPGLQVLGADAGSDLLSHYCQVFNAVEGNTTFYAWPSAQTVAGATK